MSLQVTVFGAGSIGCYLGGRLTAQGHQVRLIGRPRLQKTVQDHGLTLSQFAEDPVHLTEIEVATEADALTGSDIIALCVKSQDTEASARQIQAFAPKAQIVSFQNGISNLPILRDHLPDAMINGCVVPFNVTSPKSGHFHRGTDGDLMIGPHAPESLVAALNDAGVGARAVDDIEGYLWAKLLVNLNNALNTLSGGALRDGLLQRGYRKVLIAMIEEGLAVARAEGVNVATFNGRKPQALIGLMRKPDWLYRFLMDRIAKIDRKARSSMLDDLELGRQSELDYLQGEIVRRAELQGLTAPVNQSVMAATHAAFAQKKSPGLTGAQMVQMFLS